MTGDQPNAVTQAMHTLLEMGTLGGLSDRQLLDRFSARRDAGAEAAFSALVHRHGPMVWGVCRRALDDPHDAADAFQATFLVLVRKAGSVRVDNSLGPWLHGVSRKVSARARHFKARRSAREKPGVESAPDPNPDHHSSDVSELLAAVDREVGRLPRRYRDAVLLCDFDGLSHEDAARQLGCAVGTIGSRLSRGRQQLRDRLSRRGLAPAAFPLAPGVPPALLDSTATAAARFATGAQASIACPISTLTHEVLRNMFWTKTKTVAGVAALAATGLAVFLPAFASEPGAAPPKIESKAAEVASSRPDPDAPAAILERMTRTYAESQAYEDEGEVTQVYHLPTGKRTVIKPFRTRFLRPGSFRFEFTESNGDSPDDRNRYVIWTDAGPTKSRTWWTIVPKVEEKPLAMAIGAATGISSLASHTVPNLLMPDVVQGTSFAAMTDLKRVGDEVIGGFPCVKIEGKALRGQVTTVWIDRKTSLIRKIATTLKIPGSQVEQTTVYRPRLNPAFAPDAFEFVPPKP